MFIGKIRKTNRISKRSKPYKPGSVSLSKDFYHLSRLALAHKLHQPTHYEFSEEKKTSSL